MGGLSSGFDEWFALLGRFRDARIQRNQLLIWFRVPAVKSTIKLPVQDVAAGIEGREVKSPPLN